MMSNGRILKLIFDSSWEIYGLQREGIKSHNPNCNVAVVFLKKDGVEL